MVSSFLSHLARKTSSSLIRKEFLGCHLGIRMKRPKLRKKQLQWPDRTVSFSRAKYHMVDVSSHQTWATTVSLALKLSRAVSYKRNLYLKIMRVKLQMQLLQKLRGGQVSKSYNIRHNNCVHLAMVIYLLLRLLIVKRDVNSVAWSFRRLDTTPV